MWRRIANLFSRFRPTDKPINTTEQGAAGSASPMTYYQTLWAQRFERQQYIADCELLLLEDARMRRSYLKYINEACRGGFKFKVDASTSLGKKALALAPRIEGLLSTQLMEGMGRRVMVTGDLFTQMIVADNRVVGMKPMPTVGMERLSDDTDEIIDHDRAFAQVDVSSWQEIATFPTALMCHVRWNHDPGARYGIPEPLPSRRPWRILKLMEEANAVGRMTRASQSRLWNVGTEENPGVQEDIDTFKANNGFKEGEREIFDPTEVARDFYGNGLVTCEVLQGDPFQENVDDILHMQDVLVSSSPTPGVIFNLNAKDINRDVLEDVRSEWLKDTRHINDALDEVIRFAFDLELMLNGIDPDMVSYAIVWTTSSVERPAEHMKSIRDTYQAGLMSQRTALMQLRQYTEFEDIDTELKDIREEAQYRETPWKDGNQPENKKNGHMKETPSKGTNGRVSPGPAVDDFIRSLQ